jgi:hypothetical protein
MHGLVRARRLLGTLAGNMGSGGLLHTFVTTEVSRIRSGSKTDWRFDLAARFSLLPIAADASGALLLRHDGQVLTMGWTAGEVPRVAHNAQAFLPVLERFVQDHPEAKEVLDLHKNVSRDIVVERTRGSQ